MKFCIFGAGATGGFLGARLARAGEDVTLVARGPHLAAMRERGIEVREEEGTFVAHPTATDDTAAVRDADVVFLTVKAHGLTDIAQRIGPLLGPQTIVIPAQNGIPWWYFERSGGALEGTHLETVDPGGIIAANIETRRVLGCVVYPATEIVAPGIVQHIEGTRFTVGEIDDSRTERRDAVIAALGRAGLKSATRSRLRHEIWLKLLGNLAFNPISALTRATLQEIATFPQTREVARAAMEEALAVANALGITLEFTVEQRLKGAEAVGAHKTSMLQDVEVGRPLEVDALVGSVVEIAGLVEMPVPHIQTIYACTKLLDRTLRQAREAR